MVSILTELQVCGDVSPLTSTPTFSRHKLVSPSPPPQAQNWERYAAVSGQSLPYLVMGTAIVGFFLKAYIGIMVRSKTLGLLGAPVSVDHPSSFPLAHRSTFSSSLSL
jgi:hypothetical protein